MLPATQHHFLMQLSLSLSLSDPILEGWPFGISDTPNKTFHVFLQSLTLSDRDLHRFFYFPSINQLFTSGQHLLLLIIGLHVSTDHSVIFRSLICCKFRGAVHTFGIPLVFTLKLNPFISVGG